MDKTFDVVVIGSGSAGTSAAMALRKGNRSIAVIDERPFGGTCALRGCDPKGVLVAASRAHRYASLWKQVGVFGSAPAIRWRDLARFKRRFTDPVPSDRRKSFEDAGIVPISGKAAFLDEQTIGVESDRIRFEHAVVAAGATEMHVAAGDEKLLTSETFLDLESVPESVAFIGGGYIAFELAYLVAAAGGHAVIVNNDGQPLRGFDQDIVAHIVRLAREHGIEVHLNTTVKRVETDRGGVTLFAQTKNGSTKFRARAGVLAAGRVADLERLNLEAANIERTKKGVKVNTSLQSVSNPKIYAVGDAADGGGLPLTPVASYEGEVAARNILEGKRVSPNFQGLVSIVYVNPPLASTGLTEAQARRTTLSFDVKTADMSSWYSTRHVAAQAAFSKVILEKASGKILGATILGPHAEEQINVLALAIRGGLTQQQVAGTLFGYPTASSDLTYMFE